MKAKNSTNTPPSPTEKRSVIFSDGACSKNPGPGAWAFVLLDTEHDQVIENAGFDPATTNNRMELRAAIEGLKALAAQGVEGEVLCYTDSKLLIEGITKWIHGWKKRNWIKSDGAEVLNQELWRDLEAATQPFRGRLFWQYVPGHSDVIGNNRVDEIAVALSKGKVEELFQGSLGDYPLAEIFTQDLRGSDQAASKGGAGESTRPAAERGFAPVYLSLVNGKLERHATWAECELRVKGTKGAKFKKVKSTSEENSTLASWGLAKI